jgi:hypothetical protein
MLTTIESNGDGSSLSFLANWGALLEPLKLHPVRPDDDEGVEANDESKEAGVDNVVVTVDKVSDDLDQVEQEADDGQNKPGHHKSRLGLPGTMDEHGGNDNVADADDQKNCQHGRRPCQNSGGNRLGVARKAKACHGILFILAEAGQVVVGIGEVELTKGSVGCRRSKSGEGEKDGGCEAAAQCSKQGEHPDKLDPSLELTAAEELLHGGKAETHLLLEKGCRSLVEVNLIVCNIFIIQSHDLFYV